MNSLTLIDPTYCSWDTSSTFLLFSGNVFGNFIYYSHLLPIACLLFLCSILLWQNYREATVQWLTFITFAFIAWSLSDLVLWATANPDHTMFFWSIIIHFELLIYIGSFYFIHHFISHKRPPLYIELIIALGILIYGFIQSRREKYKARTTEIILGTFGVFFFLLSFSLGNIIGTLEIDWELGQYGLFGLPLFVGLLTFLIVKYQSFNTKLFAAQGLIMGILILILSVLFVRQIENIRIITGITTILTAVLGYLLVRSVKKEIEAKEALAVANLRQKNLIHSMNHQIKGRFLNNRIIFDELLHNARYAIFPDAVKKFLQQGYDDSTHALEYVKGILVGASAESGQLPYNMQPVSFTEIVEKVIAAQKDKAAQKGLTLTSHLDEDKCGLIGDPVQLGEVIRNLIENAVHYNSPNGQVDVTLSCTNRAARLSVKDTGIGIKDEDKPRIFSSGGRGKDSTKYNTDSSGYGLAFVKAVTEAHGGKVWFADNTEGKGTTFFVEIPLKQD